MRIKERRADGIVVRGAKCHQTGSVNSHWHIVMPTMAMGPDDKDYAVSFACPSDADGLFMIYGRQSCDTRKLEDGADIDLGNRKFGGQEALVVFDDVFIPNEYIFMEGEYDFAGMLVERFCRFSQAVIWRLQGRSRRCGHRCGCSCCGIQRCREGFGCEGQAHRDDTSQRNLI